MGDGETASVSVAGVVLPINQQRHRAGEHCGQESQHCLEEQQGGSPGGDDAWQVLGDE